MLCIYCSKEETIGSGGKEFTGKSKRRFQFFCSMIFFTFLLTYLNKTRFKWLKVNIAYA